MTILPIPARRPARKRGVTLIEAVLFISIALGLIVGGIVFFQQASLAQKVSAAVRTVSGLASETRAMFQNDGNFSGANVTFMVNAGAVPASIVRQTTSEGVTTTTFVDEWGGTMGFGAATVGGVANAGFFITYPSIPRAACIRLATLSDQGSGPVGSGIVGVQIDDANTAFTPTNAPEYSVVTAAAAATNCTANNAVTWVFRR